MALLIGKSVGGATIHVDDYDRARDGVLQCQGCEASLVAKKGEQRVHHQRGRAIRGARVRRWGNGTSGGRGSRSRSGRKW